MEKLETQNYKFDDKVILLKQKISRLENENKRLKIILKNIFIFIRNNSII
ncbi:hypothetical protein [Clostridium sp. Marseille-Q2269]|nr:hypothetical protein [Clostridium sp. Marseille-Q2269]